jgi:UDP-glucose 4-epimerase
MLMPRTILVTGGAGFIGSHAVVELLQAGHRVVIVDNLCNSSPVVLARIQAITGQQPEFAQVDLRDHPALKKVFDRHSIEAVIHFAGLKAVGESTQVPLDYYDNNVTGTLNLLECMRAAGCHDLIFSSSATVYGNAPSLPYVEEHPLAPTNPYGRTKVIIEDMCRDLAAAEPGWHIALLRYFNPVGAHPSGQIGENPKGIPNNLMPYLLQVALGRLPELQIFGADYDTLDGTGVRDYIHVVDLAEGHLAALAALSEFQGAVAINLGTGRGHSVLDMVMAMEAVVGHPLPRKVVARRPGDIGSCYASADLAAARLGWRARRSLGEMCVDAWRWQSDNPEGYR